MTGQNPLLSREMFIHGVVGVCEHGREVNVRSVLHIAATADGILYVSADGCGLHVSKATHRHVVGYLKQSASDDMVDPSDQELMLIEFEQALESIKSPADLEALWAKS